MGYTQSAQIDLELFTDHNRIENLCGLAVFIGFIKTHISDKDEGEQKSPSFNQRKNTL